MQFDLYNDIAKRTGGNIYIGVVGPVRSGKSTFIKGFMDKLIVDNIIDVNERVRVVDELPQSGDGRTIMTTQPHFVPNNAVRVNMSKDVKANVRLIDCVGYLIDGAIGAEEDGKERLVRTPWTDTEIPFKQAATLGTDKVIKDHSTIGILVTTDGSILDIERENYVSAEEKVVCELDNIGKPYVILLNTKNPNTKETDELVDEMSKKYKTTVVAKDVLKMTEEDFCEVLNDVLLEFPLKLIDVNAPRWIEALSRENDIIKELIDILSNVSENAEKMRDFEGVKDKFELSKYFEIPNVVIDASKGRIEININVKPNVFYDIISEECGHDISDDFKLMGYVRLLKKAESEYNKLKNALDEVYATGYGIVEPKLSDMEMEIPETYKQGGQFGIKIKAHAPSLHIVKVDVDTEIKPIIGGEEQCGVFAKSLIEKYDNDKDGILKTNVFGKSVEELLGDGLNSKTSLVPDETKQKMRKTLTRIVNEGKGGVLCILL